MNTLVGMPEPSTTNLVEPSRTQSWSAGRLAWIVGPLLAVLALLATVGATLWTQRDTGVHLGSAPDSVETRIQVDQKGDFSYAMMYIEEPGKDVRIVSVTPLTSSNVRFLGASTIWPRTTPYGMQGRGPGYPLEGAVELHPAAEAIPASETSYVDRPSRTTPDPIIVIAGFRLLSGDVGAFNGVQLTYVADGKMVRKVYNYAALLCHKQEACAAPEDAKYGWDIEVLRNFGLVY